MNQLTKVKITKSGASLFILVSGLGMFYLMKSLVGFEWTILIYLATEHAKKVLE